jgi:Na+(H+)/acetate symporter ActP
MAAKAAWLSVAVAVGLAATVARKGFLDGWFSE